jgi:gas vesicle protein
MLVGGVALGALAMYVLDPDRGKRRRALVKDKIYSTAVQTRKNVYAKSRDLANRTRGLYHKATHTLH